MSLTPFIQRQGALVGLDRANIDTDVIIPKQYLNSISNSGFADALFDPWRYLPKKEGQLQQQNPDFMLNQPRYKNASILLTRANFGCGSSREHAVWALRDYGFQALIAPSFGEIFYNNCSKNGILPVILTEEQVQNLFAALEEAAGAYNITLDLPQQTLQTADGTVFSFPIDDYRKQCLLKGLDEIAATLDRADHIRAYEQQRALQAPWLFADSERAT